MVAGMPDRTCKAPPAPNSLRSGEYQVHTEQVKNTHVERLDSRYDSHVHCASDYENGGANGHRSGRSIDDHRIENELVEKNNRLAL